MPRYTETEAALHFRAAQYAALLLVQRPEECDEALHMLCDAIDAANKHGTPEIDQLTLALYAAIERDDEDTDETARLIFAALAA